MTNSSVSAIIVNWNHGRFLPECLEALLAQTHAPLDVTVADNASTDGSPEWLAHAYPSVRLLTSADNRGFSRALNQAIACTSGAFVLSLNPDVVVRPGFVAELVQAANGAERVGTAVPKLLSAANPQVLDSTGLYVDRRRRPYDRGQGEVDRGQYDGGPAGAQVFGACGAAGLYRRAMLEDVACDGEYFDEDFFAYYEDADLAWRAQLRGWRCVYAPAAVGIHVRGSGDTLRKRKSGPDARGPRLALRNRYLMALKNDAGRYFGTDLPWMLASELPRLAYMAVTMPGALLGLVDLVRAWPKAARKRRLIRARRTVDDVALRHWFERNQPSH